LKRRRSKVFPIETGVWSVDRGLGEVEAGKDWRERKVSAEIHPGELGDGRKGGSPCLV